LILPETVEALEIDLVAVNKCEDEILVGLFILRVLEEIQVEFNRSESQASRKSPDFVVLLHDERHTKLVEILARCLLEFILEGI
jgi:TATA-binding protein-associated factor Taf7